jgi:hypothetical protein
MSLLRKILKQSGSRMIFFEVWICITFVVLTLRGFFLGIFSYGFEKPSAIQRRAILPIISGRDCICQVGFLSNITFDFVLIPHPKAQSGTGKTATFSISILQSIDTKVREVQVRLYHYFHYFCCCVLLDRQCLFCFVSKISLFFNMGTHHLKGFFLYSGSCTFSNA